MANTTGLGATLLREVMAAVQAGAALAVVAAMPGCSGRSLSGMEGTGGAPPATTDSSGGVLQPDGSGGTDSVEPGATGGTGPGNPTQVGGSTSSTTPSTSLAKLPAEELRCFGMDYGQDGFGYHGQCCATQRCYTPPEGESCASPDALYETDLSLPPGSGSCGCADPKGPYALNPAVPADQAGSCCYVVAAISCDGRPLLVQGEAVLAALVSRPDWSAWS